MKNCNISPLTNIIYRVQGPLPNRARPQIADQTALHKSRHQVVTRSVPNWLWSKQLCSLRVESDQQPRGVLSSTQRSGYMRWHGVLLRLHLLIFTWFLKFLNPISSLNNLYVVLTKRCWAGLCRRRCSSSEVSWCLFRVGPSLLQELPYGSSFR